MTAEELKRLLDEGKAPLVIDVRESSELETAPYPFEVRHVPLGTLAARVGDLPTDQTIVLACRSGGRSARATKFLRERGFTRAVNLDGGILAWMRLVGPPAGRP